LDFNKVTLDSNVIKEKQQKDSTDRDMMKQCPPPVPVKYKNPLTVLYKAIKEQNSSKIPKISLSSKNNKHPLPYLYKTLPDTTGLSTYKIPSKDTITIDDFAHVDELNNHELSRLDIPMDKFNFYNHKSNLSIDNPQSKDQRHSLNRRRMSDNELRLSSYGLYSDVNISDPPSKTSLTRQYSLLSNTLSTRSYNSLPRISNSNLGLDFDLNSDFYDRVGRKQSMNSTRPFLSSSRQFYDIETNSNQENAPKIVITQNGESSQDKPSQGSYTDDKLPYNDTVFDEDSKQYRDESIYSEKTKKELNFIHDLSDDYKSKESTLESQNNTKEYSMHFNNLK